MACIAPTAKCNGICEICLYYRAHKQDLIFIRKLLNVSVHVVEVLQLFDVIFAYLIRMAPIGDLALCYG